MILTDCTPTAAAALWLAADDDFDAPDVTTPFTDPRAAAHVWAAHDFETSEAASNAGVVTGRSATPLAGPSSTSLIIDPKTAARVWADQDLDTSERDSDCGAVAGRPATHFAGPSGPSFIIDPTAAARVWADHEFDRSEADSDAGTVTRPSAAPLAGPSGSSMTIDPNAAARLWAAHDFDTSEANSDAGDVSGRSAASLASLSGNSMIIDPKAAVALWTNQQGQSDHSPSSSSSHPGHEPQLHQPHQRLAQPGPGHSSPSLLIDPQAAAFIWAQHDFTKDEESTTGDASSIVPGDQHHRHHTLADSHTRTSGSQLILDPKAAASRRFADLNDQSQSGDSDISSVSRDPPSELDSIVGSSHDTINIDPLNATLAWFETDDIEVDPVDPQELARFWRDNDPLERNAGDSEADMSVDP